MRVIFELANLAQAIVNFQPTYMILITLQAHSAA